jgi:hypothetical protein
MSPAFTPADAGRAMRFRASTGLTQPAKNLIVTMLRHPFTGCNGSGDAGAGFLKGGLQAGPVSGVSTADRGYRLRQSGSVQTAYPPPRESCVRGADRAAVDKLFRCSGGAWLVTGQAFSIIRLVGVGISTNRSNWP